MIPGCEIKLLITDFDGTLVDTFRANYMAYRKAFEEVGLVLCEQIIVAVLAIVLRSSWKYAE